jgi:hypothetical protein
MCSILMGWVWLANHSNSAAELPKTILNKRPTYDAMLAKTVLGSGRVETVYRTVYGDGCRVLRDCAGGAVSRCRKVGIVT